jgi:nucleolar MIF4G domain-containing protein 1
MCILPQRMLQVINFAEVDHVTVRFLRQVLLGLLLTDSEEDFQQAFQRITVSSKLRLFQEGIRIFIHHFLLRNMSSLPQQDMDVLQLRAKMADKILSTAESKVKF